MCHACGRAHPLVRLGELGATPHDRYRRALEFSREQGIDLAGAYSVLLGLMTLPDARTGSRTHSRGWRGTRTAEDPGYDPGFRKSVGEGLLTPAQAAARGDRVAYATRLAHDHGLTMKLAFLVADGALTLAQALRTPPEQGLRLAKRSAKHSATSYLRGIIAISVGLLALVATTFWIELDDVGRAGLVGPAASRRAAPVGKAPALPAVEVASEIKAGPGGEVLEIVGPSAQAVLLAFCEAGAGRVAVRTEPHESTWKGIYREDARLGVIRIERRDDGRWRYASRGGT